MAKDPAFLFYTNDFSSGTQFFTDEQLGKFLRLLMAQHQHGHLSEKQVLIICKSHNEDTKEILRKFEKDEDGLFYNLRLENEINKRKDFSKSRSDNRLGKVKPKKKTSKSYVNHMENENKDVNKNKEVKESRFDGDLIKLQSDSFKEMWNVLICQPKWRKKNNESLNTSLKKLLSKPEPVAIKMMDNAIGGDWQGLFDLKPHELREISGNSMTEVIDKNKYSGENKHGIKVL